jgi:CRISPR-associated protein Csb2
MFGLCIHFLNGWVMAAADGANKERAEWPPHPDRVFMAMAAAWFETGQNEQEKAALEWFEQLPAPEIAASDAETRRTLKGQIPVTSYVPVNDSSLSKKMPDSHDEAKLKEAGLTLLPEFRPRQARRFPVAIPRHPEVHLIWKENLPQEHRQAIGRLCRNVVSIGHSASFVQMWLTEDPPPPTLVPVSGVATHRLRVFGAGRLEYLRARCNKDNVVRYRDATVAISTLETIRKELDQERKGALKGLKGAEKKEAEKPFKQKMAAIDSSIAECRAKTDSFGGHIPRSLRPEPSLWQGYGPAVKIDQPDMLRSIFDENLVVLSLAGKHLTLHATLKLTEAVRGALLSGCPQPIPEWISGHRPDQSPSREPHLAIIPLAFVGHEHADGRVMGVALAIPRSVDKAEAGNSIGPWLRDEYGLPRPVRLFNRDWFECQMEIETRETPPWNLRGEAWTKASKSWASVTPVVLDRHFNGKDKWEKAAEVVKDACERVGLPRPEDVLLHPVSRVEGAPHSREFPPIKRKADGGRMHHCHAVILFSEPVIGPLIVGAGRFKGYGLFRPMDRKEQANDRADR